MDTCCATPATPVNTDTDTRELALWWRDRNLQISMLAGLFLVLSIATSWFFAGNILGTLGAWISLLLGAGQFVPEALTKLASKKIGISVLMTLSAIGAVLLGMVEEAAGLAFLYSVAEALEHRAMTGARHSLRSLLDLLPTNATRIGQDGKDTQIDVSEILPGDRLRVHAGERIPTDAIVHEGTSRLDVSAVTGESIPVNVQPGDTVYAGSINQSGVLHIHATAPGSRNSLTAVVELVEKLKTSKVTARESQTVSPAHSCLVCSSSPRALGISVPITVISGIGAVSKKGIVFTSGSAFEEIGSINHIAFDKTGTLTNNQPVVVEILTDPSYTEAQILALAARLETHSHHPIARAIATAVAPDDATSDATVLDAAPSAEPHAPAIHDAPVVHDAREVPGAGMEGTVDGQRIAVGNSRWLAPQQFASRVAELEDAGATIVVVARNNETIGAIVVRDELRPEAARAVAELNAAGIGTTMLTGDNLATARTLANHAAITDVQAQLKPKEKAAAVQRLSTTKQVAMIGDGINDAPRISSGTCRNRDGSPRL
ncbi:cation-translocating P-type ATPase [Arcanobacterium phocisimile]|uniref:Cation-translocating P-type ATPase n=1 Tax=Arcanobacterium phocisimile TaxID=1302235 RepID=A0ABX7IJE7_9ACTO|nr:cation-translocating P-type ATPase [Arcanobacterium phocisimile]QRV02564.1 cation-translocating P-type ATPase [Arcanobacterium phocisimile]